MDDLVMDCMTTDCSAMDASVMDSLMATVCWQLHNGLTFDGLEMDGSVINSDERLDDG